MKKIKTEHGSLIQLIHQTFIHTAWIKYNFAFERQKCETSIRPSAKYKRSALPQTTVASAVLPFYSVLRQHEQPSQAIPSFQPNVAENL